MNSHQIASLNNSISLELEKAQTKEIITITREHLIDKLCSEIGLNKREASEIIVSFFYLIKNKLIDGHPIRITGLGLFKLLDKQARPGRNFKASEPVTLKPRRVVTFKAGAKLKQSIEMGAPARGAFNKN